MSGMKELARLMKELEDQLVVCMRCGMCQAVCPLYAETGREADVARGKLALLDGLMREMFKDPQGVHERLDRCLLCGSCAANCPSGVRVLDIFMKARAILAGYMGLPPAKRAILRGLLAHPRLFDLAMEWGARFQKLFTRPVDDVLGTSCARFASPLIGNRHFRSPAPVPFHRLRPSLRTETGRSGLRVAFFPGCLLDKFFPEAAEASLEVLARHGVGVFMPDQQACCGIPAVSSGDTDTFLKLVKHNLERFQGESFDYLVTSCATCTSTIKKVWPALASEDDRELRRRVEALAAKTLDIHQFLVDKAGISPPSPEPDENAPVVTYHDPCHLKKSLGVASQPRALLRANPRYRFKEMTEPDRCCGLGGSFSLEHYDLSSAIGKVKREDIESTGCSVVATGCPACMLQLSDMLSQGRLPVRVKHAIEIYAETVRES